MGETHECDDVEEFRTGRWSRGEHKMVTAPAQSAPTSTSSAPAPTTKAPPAKAQTAQQPAAAPVQPAPPAEVPTADVSGGGGKHEAQ